MKTVRRNTGIVISGADEWDVEAMEHMEHRIGEVARQFGYTDPRIRMTLEHDAHGHRFSTSVHFATRRRTLHAHASGTSPEIVIAQIDQRLSALLDRDRQRRWRTRRRCAPGTDT